MAATDGESVEDMLRLIRGPLGQESRFQANNILVLSDTTGLMAKSAVEKSLAQFNGCGDERFFRVRSPQGEDDDEDLDEACDNTFTHIHPFLKTEQDVASILKKAEALSNSNTLVVYTFADPVLREQTRRMCELSGFGSVDLLGPMFDAMSGLLQQQPLGQSLQVQQQGNQGVLRSDQASGSNGRRRRSLSDKYFRRIEAVEYTLKCDDGKSPKDWNQADIVLCGVSRTGKTPLSVVLSHTMGLKVANVPLVVDLAPPCQLLDPDNVDPNRVFCLTLQLNDLVRIRRHRLRKAMRGTGRGGRGGGGSSMAERSSTYANPSYLLQDLDHAKQVAAEYGFTEIDVTGRAVEETASLISALLNQRFPQDADP